MLFVSQKIIDGKTYTLYREKRIRTKENPTPLKEWVVVDSEEMVETGKGKNKKLEKQKMRKEHLLKVKAKEIWNNKITSLFK